MYYESLHWGAQVCKDNIRALFKDKKVLNLTCKELLYGLFNSKVILLYMIL